MTTTIIEFYIFNRREFNFRVWISHYFIDNYIKAVYVPIDYLKSSIANFVAFFVKYIGDVKWIVLVVNKRGVKS